MGQITKTQSDPPARTTAHRRIHPLTTWYAFALAGLLFGGLPGCGDDNQAPAVDASPMADAGPNLDATSNADAGPNDGNPPEVSIVFPPPSALTDDPAIEIRGRASDADGLVAIRVHGVPATTNSGFADWRVVVPLTFGDNTIEGRWYSMTRADGRCSVISLAGRCWRLMAQRVSARRSWA